MIVNYEGKHWLVLLMRGFTATARFGSQDYAKQFIVYCLQGPSGEMCLASNEDCEPIKQKAKKKATP